MKKHIIGSLVICTILLFVMINIAPAATTGRIVTNGKVTMYKNGKVVNSFTKQGPVDDKALIACDGNCLVKIKGVSLIAEDKSRFALKQKDNSLSLFVETGKVNFAVSDLSKEFSFYYPGNYFVKSIGFITSASTASSAKGFMHVDDKGARIGMDEGTIITQTNNGTQKIGPGQNILLAMVDVPPPANKEECVDDPKTTKDECCVDDPKTEEDECDDKAGLFLLSSGGSQFETTAGLIIGGGAAITAAVLLNDALNDDDTSLRIGEGAVPIEPVPPSTSPNK